MEKIKKEYQFGQPLNTPENQPEELPVDNKNNEEILDIQTFMNDMSKLGQQLRSPDLMKPNFNFGQLEITNYLIWLLLGEIMKLNNKLEIE